MTQAPASQNGLQPRRWSRPPHTPLFLARSQPFSCWLKREGPQAPEKARVSGAKWGHSEASRKYSDSWHPHTGLPCRVSRGCPLSPQHWQQHLTWACPTGASFTSPSHCEYRPRLATSLQASALCLSCWLSARLADSPASTPPSGTSPPLSAPP